MKQQVLILKVKYDETELYSPKNWNWSELIGCKGDCVEVVNYGTIEDVREEELHQRRI